LSEYWKIKTLIVDPAGYSRDLLRGILIALGVVDTLNMPNCAKALSALQAHHRDVVFCDERAGNCAEFMKVLRRDVGTRNITVPVFLISAGVQEEQILVARDAGMNGVIVKPVSVATVKRKLSATLKTPKDFVTTKAFIGPDRRTGREDRRIAGDRLGFEDRRVRTQPAEIFPVPPTLRPKDD